MKRRGLDVKYVVMLVFVIAFALRLYAVICLPSYLGPDGHEYSYIAEEIVKFIKGIPVEDLSKLKETVEHRGWLHPVFIAAVYSVKGVSPALFKVILALIDALSCILIFCIARHLVGKKEAFTALLIAVVYPGFIYFCTFLSQETSTIFLLLLIVGLTLQALESKNGRLFFWLGAVVGLLTFYRPAFQFLFAPYFLTSLFFIKQQGRAVKRFTFLLAGFLLIVFCWIIFSKAAGTPVILYKSNSWNVYDNLLHDGWPTDDYYPLVDAELKAILAEEGLGETTSGPYNLLPNHIYIKAALKKIMADPVWYLGLCMQKWDYLWWNIDTYPGRWHSNQVWRQLLLHRSLIVFAVIGAPLVLLGSMKSAFLVMIIFYGSLICLPFVGLPRYNIPLMPFIIIIASSFVVQLTGEIGRLLTLENRKKIFAVFLLVTFPGIALLFLNVPFLLKAFASVAPINLYYCSVAGFNMFLFCVAAALFIIFGPGAKRFLVLVSIFFIAIFFNNEAVLNRTWHEWEAPLLSNNQKVAQVIHLKKGIDPADYRSARIMLDLFQIDRLGNDYVLEVLVNGQKLKTYSQGIKARSGKFDEKFFGFYKMFFFDTYKLVPEDLRQWYEIPVPLSLLKDCNLIDIMLSFDKDKNNNHGIIVFGDYHVYDNVFEGPAFTKTDFDTSLYKIMPYSGDSRLERRTRLESEKSVSKYFDGKSWRNLDLSEESGIQSGTYRIRIELIDNNGIQTIM